MVHEYQHELDTGIVPGSYTLPWHYADRPCFCNPSARKKGEVWARVWKVVYILNIAHHPFPPAPEESALLSSTTMVLMTDNAFDLRCRWHRSAPKAYAPGSEYSNLEGLPSPAVLLPRQGHPFL